MFHGAGCRLVVPLTVAHGFSWRGAALTDSKDVLQDDTEVLGVIGLELVGHPRYGHKQPMDEVLWAGESSRTDSVPASRSLSRVGAGSTRACTSLPLQGKGPTITIALQDVPTKQQLAPSTLTGAFLLSNVMGVPSAGDGSGLTSSP